MKALTASELFGNWVPVLLPINEDDQIDFARLKAQLDYFVSCRVDGIYTNGTAGELHEQSEAEFLQITRLVAETCEQAGIRFQIGVSHMSALTSLARVKRAIVFKPGALQVILPDWVPLTDDEAIMFLQRIAETADGIGLVFYNPPFAKRVLEPSNYSKLKNAVPSLIGLKVVDGDATWYSAMREHAAGPSVFVPGHHLATGISQGTVGAYSNVACLNPKGAQWWYELMKTDLDAALKIESRIRQFWSEYVAPFKSRVTAPDKLVAVVGGWGDVGHAWASAPSQAANAHAAFAAGSRTFEWAMPYSALRHEMLVEPWKIVDGQLHKPTAPGLGVELTDELIARYPYEPGGRQIRETSVKSREKGLRQQSRNPIK